MAMFLSELRSIAEYYNFGDSLKTMLRDRLVCGINDNRIQQKLLSEEKGLTHKSVVKLAQAMEADSVELKPQVPQPTIQKLTKWNHQARNLAIVAQE